MSNPVVNTLADVIGITRAVLYRTFVERSWSPEQPMFNVVEVKAGKALTFEKFLTQAQGISGKFRSPVSLGPYRNAETRTYIYVTHYASTWAFIKVMLGLTISLATLKRSAAIQRTIWTYSNATNSLGLQDLKRVLVVGVQGSSNDFLNFLRQHSIEPAATVECVKDVRGKSLGDYFVLPDTSENKTQLDGFRREHGDVVVYQVARFE